MSRVGSVVVNTHLDRGTAVDVPEKLSRRTMTRRNKRRQDNRFTFVCARNFWTKFKLSELFEAYLPSRDGTSVERGAPESGTPIGRTGPRPRSGGKPQVKMLYAGRWALIRHLEPEGFELASGLRLLENASRSPIDCVGVDATTRDCVRLKGSAWTMGMNVNERQCWTGRAMICLRTGNSQWHLATDTRILVGRFQWSRDSGIDN